MGKSFKERMAALEKVEAAQMQVHDLAQRSPEPLTIHNCDKLRTQIVFGNIAIAADGALSHRWALAPADSHAELMTAITRWNALLPHLADPPLTTAALDAWLAEAIAAEWEAWRVNLSFALELLDGGMLAVRAFNPAQDLRQYGQQIKHQVWASGVESGVAAGDPLWPWIRWIQQALDGHQQHTGGPFAQSTAAARAVLAALLEANGGNTPDEA